MSSRVVVVKRTRPRTFALLRSLPGWLRAVWLSLRAPESGSTVAGDGSLGERPSLPTARAARAPILVRSERGGHRCTACHLCVEICPSRCLALRARTGPGAESDPRPASFSLAIDRCIGCGDCVRDCPEGALSLEPDHVVVWSGSERQVDLLRMVGSVA